MSIKSDGSTLDGDITEDSHSDSSLTSGFIVSDSSLISCQSDSSDDTYIPSKNWNLFIKTVRKIIDNYKNKNWSSFEKNIIKLINNKRPYNKNRIEKKRK